MDTLTAQNNQALDKFFAAWNSKEPEEVLSVVHPEFVYIASVGPEPGNTYKTKEELREGLRHMFAYDQGAHIDILERHIHGNKGYVLWRYRFNRMDTTEEIALGCDLLTFRDGMLFRKDAYRKVLSGN